MFDHYLYISAVSTTLSEHLQSVADMLIARCRLGTTDLVVDIGANDGSLLAGFRAARVRVLGVDPATNLRHLAEARGVPIVNDYFGSRTARKIVAEHGRASVITATNTFPHIPALEDFLQGIDRLLKPNGVFMVEAHYLLDMFDQGAFDTIYHEHVSYWALTPMVQLLRRYGLQAVRVERLPLHHGQLRVFIQRIGEAEVDESVPRLLDWERSRGVPSCEPCREFARRTQSIKPQLMETLDRLRAAGASVVGYGAPAKGNTLISFLQIDQQSLPYIADRSPLKQGRFTPGAHIPIVPPEKIFEDMPDYVLILAWNFAEEIMQQLAEYRNRGGRFILPVPEVRIL